MPYTYVIYILKYIYIYINICIYIYITCISKNEHTIYSILHYSVNIYCPACNVYKLAIQGICDRSVTILIDLTLISNRKLGY